MFLIFIFLNKMLPFTSDHRMQYIYCLAQKKKKKEAIFSTDKKNNMLL